MRIRVDLYFWVRMQRQVNIKSGAHTRITFYGYTSPVVLHNLLAKGKADAGTCIDMVAVQSLEDGKDLISILLLEADAIIFESNDCVRCTRFAAFKSIAGQAFYKWE